MKKGQKIVYRKDESLSDWLEKYKEEHGTLPTKPIYCDYRSVEGFEKEILLMADGTSGNWAVVDYNAEEHGPLDDRYHKFIPYSGRN